MQHVWHNHLVQNYLKETYRNLILDNVEEDTPIAHDLLRNWLPDFDSALIIYDHEAGYRSFLGSDPHSATSLKKLCNVQVLFDHSFFTSAGLQDLSAAFAEAFHRQRPAGAPGVSHHKPDGEVLVFEDHRYYPEMLDWVAAKTAILVNEAGIPPWQIAILAPYLSDALRFSLIGRLEQAGIPVRSHRPSRALR